MQKKSIKRSIFGLILLFFNLTTILAQSKWFPAKPQLVIGTSLTDVIEKHEDFAPYYFHELTWSNNVAFQVFKRYYQGIEYMAIHTISPRNGKMNYHLFGTFGQIYVFEYERMKLYGEFGYYEGNYCICQIGESYKRKGLSYYSLGGGAQFYLYKFLYLDAAFLSRNIINPIPEKYSYNVYILGLNLVFDSSRFNKD